MMVWIYYNLYQSIDRISQIMSDQNYGREPTYQDRGKGLGLESEKWFPKLEIDVVKLWNQIEHDLYRAALLANRELDEEAKNERDFARLQ